MQDFTQLKKNLKGDFSKFKIIKIGLLGDTPTQLLNQALRGMGFEAGLNLDVWEADFDQVERQVHDPHSELYKAGPQVVVIFQSTLKLLGKYNRQPLQKRSQLASAEIDSIKALIGSLEANSIDKIIYFNYAEIDDRVFGNFGNKTESSFLFQIRKLNHELMLVASTVPSLHVCDLSTIQNVLGKASFFQPALYVNTEMVLSLDALPMVASQCVDIVGALYGRFKKCVIVDLDHTLWGGVIGDDGLEKIEIGDFGIGKAYSGFQYWIKKLKQRGIIVAVCSKNTEAIAKEPFEKHPEMVLRLDDIAVFVANWENKADNIRKIQRILNIGFDSMVFLDDNPFERNLVRQNIPDVCVPELPEDPAEYLEYLYSLNLFETVSFSHEDVDRTKLYQVEAQRNSLQERFTNEKDFLRSLGMKSVVESFNKFNTPRVAQLSQRSNQFNLRTIRYSEAEVEKMRESSEYFTFAFSLEDKFGEHGLISAIILRKVDNKEVFIDTWIMSCRVLKRGMENFVLNTIVEFARREGFGLLKGEYLPTAKNELVKDHYLELGFSQNGKVWELFLDGYQERESCITIK